MILTDVIQAAAEAHGYIFINARRDIANVAIDEKPGSMCAVLYEWSEDLEMKKNNMLPTFRCLLFVIEKSELNDNALAVEAVVQRQRGGCKKILAAIRDNDEVTDLLSANIGEVLNVFDSNYSGVDTEFRVKLREDDTEC